MTVTLNSRIEHPEGADGAPSIILMHGLFGSASNWRSVQRLIGKQWQVHSMDLRNHGASGWAQSMSYREMAADVLAYMDLHGLASATILGHSMGGKVAMTMALIEPRRVDALVVVDIAPVSYAPTLLPFLQAMQRLNLVSLLSRRDADAQLAPDIPDNRFAAFYYRTWFLTSNQMAQTPGVGGLTYPRSRLAMTSLGEFDSGEVAPARLSGPVLSIYGAESPYMQASSRAAMQEWFPQSQFSEIAAAGHWVHAEQPQAFNQQLTAFLDVLSLT